MKDDEKEDLIGNLQTTYAFIQKCLDSKLPLFVHCVAGLSRSPAVVIGYLMKANKLSFDQAFDLVRKKRSKICCNDGFKRQLKLWHEMNWTLNINYRPYRLHQLSILTHSVNYYLQDISSLNSMNNLKQAINSYLTQFHDNSKLTSGKVIFKCKKCRLYLFNEINVLTSSTSNNSTSTFSLNSRDIYNNVINSNCGSIYIEPLKFMMDEISCLSGILNCSNCFSRIGKFNWNYIDCATDCNKHSKMVPSFKIDCKKVDHHVL